MERRSTCVGDYSNASWSWNKALKPYLRPAEEAAPKYEVVYEKPEGSLDIVERAYRASGIMEKVAAFAGQYAWVKGFAIDASSCVRPKSWPTAFCPTLRSRPSGTQRWKKCSAIPKREWWEQS